MLGVEAAAVRLMKSRDAPTKLQRIAGSVITALSDMPVISETSDEVTGSVREGGTREESGCSFYFPGCRRVMST